jgi:hypothetical protein
VASVDSNSSDEILSGHVEGTVQRSLSETEYSLP